MRKLIKEIHRSLNIWKIFMSIGIPKKEIESLVESANKLGSK